MNQSLLLLLDLLILILACVSTAMITHVISYRRGRLDEMREWGDSHSDQAAEDANELFRLRHIAECAERLERWLSGQAADSSESLRIKVYDPADANKLCALLQALRKALE